jgi:hypothetical protein
MSALSDDGEEDFDYDSDAGFDSDDGANALLEDDVSGGERRWGLCGLCHAQ